MSTNGLQGACTVREYDSLRLQPVHTLVPRVEHVLVPSRPADGPQLAIDEADQVGDGQACAVECLGKLVEVRRPGREGALVDEVGEV